MPVWLQSIAALLCIGSSFAIRSRTPSYATSRKATSLDSAISGTQPSSNNTSSLNETRIYCSGSSFGWDLRISSCLDALFQFDSTQVDANFGSRDRGSFDVPLPARSLSGDGNCALTIDISRAIVDQASWKDIRDAADDLIYNCVIRGHPSEGGLATSLGRHRHLSIKMTAYTPNVHCYRSRGFAPQDCGEACHQIELTSHNVKLLHEGGGPGDLTVPYVVQPALQDCIYTVDVAGAEDWESTYHIWEAMVALDDMCARFGKVGTAYGLGQDGNVIVELGTGSAASISKP